MNRLLQGESAAARRGAARRIIAVENRCQVAVLAPTEILAASTILLQELFLKLGYVVALLSGSRTQREKRN